MDKIKILRIMTVPISLKILTKGQMRFLSENGYEVHCASSEGSEIKELYESELIKTHTILPLKRFIDPISDLKAIYSCYKLIKKLKPKIVHTYTPKAGLVGMMAAFLAGSKIRLHNITGLPLIEKEGIQKNILIIIERFVISLASVVYVNSSGLLDYINSQISKSRKLKVLGNGSTNGINLEYFKKNEDLSLKATELRKNNEISSSDFVWLYVGRLVKDKGINELVEAFSFLSEKFSNMKLLLVGLFEENLDPLTPETIRIINKSNKIVCSGFIDDVRPYYMASECLVFPSYREGLPNVPLQAACFNLPIIASDINGCNEIVIDRVNGLLVPPKNVELLIKAMEKMYLDTEKREFFIKNSRKLIEEKYNQALVWNKLLEEYKNIMDV